MFQIKAIKIEYSTKAGIFTSHINNISIFYKCYNHFINIYDLSIQRYIVCF
jgi:hypothetical protein